MTCNGICVRYKAAKQVGKDRYALGQKRCNGCEIFISWDGLWCPCCNYKLRSRPRSGHYKTRFIEQTKKLEINT
ncbi:MAG: hypothetical protein FJ357_06135 [Thaumarchaeota archaeon]|nr:hypothetical protein [Nitrososphaerota archaeon]